MDISIYQETRDILYHALTEIGYTCIHPDGAFYLFVKALEEDDTKFCERAKEEKILMAPVPLFMDRAGYVSLIVYRLMLQKEVCRHLKNYMTNTRNKGER